MSTEMEFFDINLAKTQVSMLFTVPSTGGFKKRIHTPNPYKKTAKLQSIHE
jgi:hypothetical protein